MTRLRHYWGIAREHGFSLRFLASRILKRIPFAHRLIVIDRCTYKLRFYASSLTATIWENPAWESEDEIFFEKYLRRGDTVIDVGANIGTLSLTAASIVGDEGKVIAIEAHPKTFGFLKGNIDLNGYRNIRSYNVAMGDKNGTVAFSSKSSDDQNAIVREGTGIQVTMRRLDELFRDEKGIDLLKIDVEGFEKFVLSGAEALLGGVECIYFESMEEHFARYGYTTRELAEQMRGKGFTIYRIDADTAYELPGDYVSESCENLAAIRDRERFLERTRLSIRQ